MNEMIWEARILCWGSVNTDLIYDNLISCSYSCYFRHCQVQKAELQYLACRLILQKKMKWRMKVCQQPHKWKHEHFIQATNNWKIRCMSCKEIFIDQLLNHRTWPCCLHATSISLSDPRPTVHCQNSQAVGVSFPTQKLGCPLDLNFLFFSRLVFPLYWCMHKKFYA